MLIDPMQVVVILLVVGVALFVAPTVKAERPSSIYIGEEFGRENE